MNVALLTPKTMATSFSHRRRGYWGARGVIDLVGQRPVLSATERDRRERDGIAHISRQFARYGLTSVHHEGGDLAAIQDVRVHHLMWTVT